MNCVERHSMHIKMAFSFGFLFPKPEKFQQDAASKRSQLRVYFIMAVSGISGPQERMM